MHLLEATSRSAGAGDAGGAGSPLPRPASPGRLRAAPPAAGGRPGPDLTAAEAPRRRERSGKRTARRPPALVPSQRQPGRRSSASRVCAPGSRSERGKAHGQSPGGERGSCGGFASLVSFLKGFGDHAGFPGARELLKAASSGSDAKVVRSRLRLAEGWSRWRGVCECAFVAAS